MASERQGRVLAVLESVISRRDGGDFLEDHAVINAHPELAPELEEQLSALSRVDEAEAQAAEDSDARELDLDELPTIPGCRIRKECHRGGQGVVYRALQVGTGREVAVKVLRNSPFSGPADRERFDREARVLGRLRHPNIVTIHDRGRTAGCHYFVMDFIRGVPVDTYVAQHRMSVEERLRLFLKICGAVTAAHLRGIIHRDLKPSNILVDERGEPHVLDFGLAKLSSELATGASAWRTLTMTGQFVGSVPWASPEQAEGPGDRVDVRTDIYALGVLLYHMLTRRFPYEVTGPWRDVLKNILESEPTRPSTHRPELGEDVDTIILKCLAKEPERRYQSVVILAEDVERFLSNRPIVARAPSTLYHLRKLVVRHKLPFALLVTLFVAASAFAITMSALYARAERERVRAVRAEQLARQREEEAEREAAIAKAINTFLTEDVLTSTSPEVALGRDITMREVLETASRSIDTSLSDQPVVRASILATIGQTYTSLGAYGDAERFLNEARDVFTEHLGDEHVRTLSVRVAILDVLWREFRHKEGDAHSKRLYETCRRVLGDGHELTLRAAALRAWHLWYSGNSEDAANLFADTVAAARTSMGARPAAYVSLLNTLASWSLHVDEPGKADVLREAIDVAREALGKEHPQTLAAMTNLGLHLTNRRRFDEAEPLLRDALAARRNVLGPEHPAVLASILKLSVLQRESDRLDEAEAGLRDALDIAERNLGPLHSLTFDITQALSNTLMRQGRQRESLVLAKRALAGRRSVFGDEEPRTADSLDNVSLAYLKLGRFAETEEGLRTACAIDRRTRTGVADHVPAGCLRRLVRALAGQGKLDEARPFAVELLARREAAANLENASAYALNSYARDLLDVEPADLRNPELALATALRAAEHCTEAYHYNKYTIGAAYAALGDVDRGIAMVTRALARVPLEDSLERRDYEDLLGRLLEASGDPMAVEASYAETVAARRASFPADHPDLATALERYASVLLRHDKPDEAETALTECLAIREAVLNADDYLIGHTMSLIGEAYMRRGLFVEAESWLVEGYEQMTTDEYVSYFDYQNALARLIELCELTDRSDEAEAYRDELRALRNRAGQPIPEP